MKSSSSKWKKVIFAVLGLFLIAGFWFSYKVVSALPSKSDIAGALKETKLGGKTEAANTTKALTGASSESSTQNTETAQLSEAQKKAAEKKAAMETLMSLVEEDPRDIRVCDHLSDSKVNFQDKERTNFEFDEMFGAERTDPVYEAFRIPMKALFQEPTVSALFREVEGLSAETENKDQKEKESFLQKAGFYARVAKSAASLYRQKEQFESLGDRAMHLSVLAQVASTRSEFKDDARLRDFCKRIQSSDLTLDRTQMMDERKELIELLREKGLQPKDVGFDPESWIKLSVKADKNGFNFSLSDKEEVKENKQKSGG